MTNAPLEGIAVDFCPGCQGLWFDRGELERTTGVPLSQLSVDPILWPHPERHRCPRCAQELCERRLLSFAREPLAVEQCPSCSGIYFDRGEYLAARRAAKLSARNATGRRRPRPPASTAEAAEPILVEPDSHAAVLFQYLTGLPMEIGCRQKLFSPAVTILIALNCAVYLLASVNSPSVWIARLGMVPAEVLSRGAYWTLLTSMFMHAGVGHLLGNMYFLFIAGDNIEEDFGFAGFLLLYFTCGVAADAGHIYADVASEIPAVGASGAISGVLGAYLVMYPARKFLCRFFYLAWLNLAFQIPAVVYLGLWLALQFIFAAIDVQGVAWWAHIAGFVAGSGIALAGRLLGMVRPSGAALQ